jgi:hypothetical protein
VDKCCLGSGTTSKPTHNQDDHAPEGPPSGGGGTG